MAKRAAAALLLALLGCAAVTHAQQPICKTYKKLLTVSESKLLMDTMIVSDSAPIQSVSLSSMSVAYPKIGNLQVSLLQGVPGSAPTTAVVLKSAQAGAEGANMAGTAFSDASTTDFPAAGSAPFTGSFKPYQPMAAFNGKDAAGAWYLRVADVSAEAATSPITLTGWGMEICFTTAPVPAPDVTAAQGGINIETPQASVTLGSEGLSVMVANQTQNASTNATDVNATMANATSPNVTGMSGPGMFGLQAPGFKSAVMNLLFPFAIPDNQPQAVAFALPGDKIKDAVAGAVINEVTDLAALATAKSTAINNYLNKKVGDYINTVNAGSTALQGLIKGGHGQIAAHVKNALTEALAFKKSIGRGGIKATVQAQLAKQVDHIMAVGTQFMNVFASLASGMAGTGSLLKDAVTGHAKAVVDTYTTTEGIVAAHITNAILMRVAMLSKMLDTIEAAATAAQAVTGPVLDMKLQAIQWKMSLLNAALEKLAQAIKAFPKPSDVMKAKMTIAGNLISLHPMGKFAVDPEVALAQLYGRIGQFNDWMAKTFGCTGVNCQFGKFRQQAVTAAPAAPVAQPAAAQPAVAAASPAPAVAVAAPGVNVAVNPQG